MKNIIDIYEEYKIMSNLQEHQLRVAAVTKQICESMTAPIDTEAVVIAALVHDMGNVIKFDLLQTKQIFGLTDSEIVLLKNVQDEFKNKYGPDEHEATILIAKELGLDQKIVSLADENRFSRLCMHRDSEDLLIKILHYADARVGPRGVLSYNARMDDAGVRYKDHKNSVEEEKRIALLDCGRDMEKQIFSQSKIKPEDINDLSVAPYIEELKKFSI